MICAVNQGVWSAYPLLLPKAEQERREREWEWALAGLHVRAGEAREKNESLGTRKENQEPALGWKEKSDFIAPWNRLGEKMKEAC